MPLFRLKEDYSAHPRRWWHIPLLLLLIVGTVIIAREYNGSSASTTKWKLNETQQNEGAVFGTFYHLTYRSTQNLQSQVDSVLTSVDFSLSPFNPRSIITAINENRSTQTNEQFRQVFQLASNVYDATKGAFDITVAPIVNAWGFGFRQGITPDSLQIDSLMQFVGFEKVQLRADTITKADPRLMLDCSAIAKGFGVDAVAQYMEAQGVTDYMIEIGGEIRLSGYNPQGQIWHIGVSKPVADTLSTDKELEQILEVSDIAIATSGNYRNFRLQADGQTVGHTIDPRTGTPVQRTILSATVLAKDCATADAYATAFMVLGLEESKAILANHPELKAYFICTDEQERNYVWHSPTLQLP